MNNDLMNIIILFILFNIVILYLYHNMNGLNKQLNTQINGRPNTINMPPGYTSNLVELNNNGNNTVNNTGNNVVNNVGNNVVNNVVTNNGNNTNNSNISGNVVEPFINAPNTHVSGISRDLDTTKHGFHDNFFNNNNKFLGWRKWWLFNKNKYEVSTDPNFNDISTQYYLQNMDNVKNVYVE